MQFFRLAEDAGPVPRGSHERWTLFRETGRYHWEPNPRRMNPFIALDAMAFIL